ncbi:histidine kinase [Aquibacillus koreensis]|uniref:histidine kinase n=1 Tax=Aquibacillus koreensis TaxID=279446 RepID=A0A9X3WMX8_9BACI|nr:LytS/YhcK type 5TM receptor domain-containing protein [Aquibacillus koreensis]MCT2537837.1 histidine kinase [Aquibacillus koreensis]MDC3421131.1 histidine kinase [Aquibacillus koreensis]
MFELTITLFERIGLLLLITFMLTRIPRFRSLLDRDMNVKTAIYHALVFGLLSIMGTHIGVVVNDEGLRLAPWILDVKQDEMMVGFSLVVVMIAGLLGGPFVGFGSGIIAAIYVFFIGDIGWLANSLINPVAGLLAGWTGQFFSQERVIAPNKALFIGIFPPVLHMSLFLIFLPDQKLAVDIVNTIGIPLVITNSVALAIITMMIRIALNETEREAAIETNRALSITEKTLPLLRQDSFSDKADEIAQLLYDELNVDAISVTDRQDVLAHVGLGRDHHCPGDRLKMQLSHKAIEGGEIQVAYNKNDIQCRFESCPLTTAIMVPIYRSGEVIGLINLYYRHSQQIRTVETTLARGLGTLISNQISGLEAERMKALLKDAEMRNLQAQINPHFLFNTFNLIHSLLRVDAAYARHILVQLSQYMRANLKIANASLIPLHKEVSHLNAYLEIVKARFPDEIIVEIDIESGIEDVLIPPATLQPLVENSIQHGIDIQKEIGKITVKIKKEAKSVFVEVEDNGKGFSEELLQKIGKEPLTEQGGNGIALYNINERMKGLLGEQAGLQFMNHEYGGVVSFTLPIGSCDDDETFSESETV